MWRDAQSEAGGQSSRYHSIREGLRLPRPRQDKPMGVEQSKRVAPSIPAVDWRQYQPILPILKANALSPAVWKSVKAVVAFLVITGLVLFAVYLLAGLKEASEYRGPNAGQGGSPSVTWGNSRHY